jgi:hypothetical protein
MLLYVCEKNSHRKLSYTIYEDQISVDVFLIVKALSQHIIYRLLYFYLNVVQVMGTHIAPIDLQQP